MRCVMSAYRDQSAPDRLKLWERIASESPAEQSVAPHTMDPSPVLDTLESDVGRREAGLARVTTPRTEVLPPTGRVERIKRRRADCEAGCQCVLCHSLPGHKDIRGQVDLTGQPVSLANVRAEARADHEARREANRARQAQQDSIATQRRIDAVMRRYTR